MSVKRVSSSHKTNVTSDTCSGGTYSSVAALVRYNVIGSLPKIKTKD